MNDEARRTLEDEKLNWTDEALTELDKKLQFPKSLENLTAAHQVLTQFFNFYLTGRLEPNIKPHQLIFSCISYLEIRESPNIKLITTMAKPVSFDLSYIRDQVAQHQIVTTNNLTKTKNDRQTFLASIQNKLIMVESGPMNTDAAQLLLLASFLALVTFRACCKNKKQMTRTFNKKLLKVHLHNLAMWPIQCSYSPPCKLYVSACTKGLNKTHRFTGFMMAKVLRSWRDVRVTGKQPKSIALIQTTLLAHTAYNGLGLIEYATAAQKALSCSLRELLRWTLTEQSKDSWQLLLSFERSYWTHEKLCQTYFWARIINDKYFQEYASKLHPYLTGMFAGIVSTVQTNGSVEDAQWFKQTRIIAQNGLEYGKKTAKSFRESNVALIMRSFVRDQDF